MVLLIDNYDSFTYNVYQYVGSVDPDVRVIRNDAATIDEIRAMNPDQIIISPGPGTPDDAGISMDVIREMGAEIPVLGICLGHQCIGQVYGATVGHAQALHHGKQSTIQLMEAPLFEGLSRPFQAARYHSLAVVNHTVPDCLKITAYTDDGEVMAVEHREHPVYGIQFHPESIYTPEGMQLIRNFLSLGKKVEA